MPRLKGISRKKLCRAEAGQSFSSDGFTHHQLGVN
jgi:hypothetical protein